MKAWRVGPYNDNWCFIAHAPSRAKARQKGMLLIGEWTNIRATRLPSLDGKIVTRDRLLIAGFPPMVEGEPLDPYGYLLDCGCKLCKLSRAKILAAGKPQPN